MSSIEEIKKNRKPVDRTSNCVCCGGTEDILPLETKLYSDFGGWNISKDGEHVEIPNQDGDDWDNLTPLSEIEELAKKAPNHEWLAIVYLPLRGATYKRSDCGNWVLIETNEGFA